MTTPRSYRVTTYSNEFEVREQFSQLDTSDLNNAVEAFVNRVQGASSASHYLDEVDHITETDPDGRVVAVLGSHRGRNSNTPGVAPTTRLLGVPVRLDSVDSLPWGQVTARADGTWN